MRQPWKHVIEVARRIKVSGTEISIVSSGSHDSTGEEILGVRVRRAKKPHLFFDTDSLFRAIKDEKADVINWHCSDIWSSVYFWRLRKKIKTNVVWTLHSGILSPEDLRCLSITDYVQLYKFWNNIFNASLPKSLIRKWATLPFLRHTITLSKRTALRLETYGLDRNAITSISSGVDTGIFKPSVDSNNMQDLNILYYGPLSSFRGTDVLFSAFKTIRKKLRSAHMTLLARGENERRSWRRRTEEESRHVKIITGVLGQDELIRHLNIASLVVLPFKFWPQVECPLTLLEPMSMSKPTVSTAVGAIPEIVSNGETGFLVPAKDSMQLAKSIIGLLANEPLCERIGRNARARIERFHDWDIIAKRTLEVLYNASD